MNERNNTANIQEDKGGEKKEEKVDDITRINEAIL